MTAADARRQLLTLPPGTQSYGQAQLLISGLEVPEDERRRIVQLAELLAMEIDHNLA
jgi:hypothetical protein